MPDSTASAPEEKIIELIMDWAGCSRADAVHWYRSQPIPAVGGKTARQLAEAGDIELIHNYLDHLERGGFA